MDIPLLVSIVFAVGLLSGIWIGFAFGFSRAMREAANRMQTGSKWPGIWWICGGGLSLIVATGTALYSLFFIITAQHTAGVITEMRESTDKEYQTTYAPTFTFRDAANTEHTVASTFYSSPPKHRIGDVVPVLYRVSDPEGARIDCYLYHWFVPTMTGTAGAIFLAIGFVVRSWPRIVARFKRKTALP